MRFMISLAATAATLVAAAPASAQQASASAQALAKGTVVQPLTLTKVSDLDFGTVVSSATAGNVVIDANTGGRTTSVGVTGLPSFPGGRGVFRGVGTAGNVVDVTLSAPSVLVSQTNATDVITVNSMSLDSASANVAGRTIGASGVFDIGVGGDFAIAANQPAAVYQAQFTVTANYH